MTLNILFIGDIVGKPGLDMVQTWLPSLEKKYRILIHSDSQLPQICRPSVDGRPVSVEK